jgi:hypothetical protein
MIARPRLTGLVTPSGYDAVGGATNIGAPELATLLPSALSSPAFGTGAIITAGSGNPNRLWRGFLM